MSQQILQECMEYFKEALKDYMCKEFQRVFGENWVQSALSPPGTDTLMTMKKNPKDWDVHVLINLMHNHWDQVFSKNISDKFPRSLFTVIKFYRNSWAHQSKLTDRDIYRIIDLIQVVLEGLEINHQVIDQKRNEMLDAMTRNTSIYQNSQPKFSCAGCGRVFLCQFKFECISCGLLGCVCCMNDRILRGFNDCPQCNRGLMYEELCNIHTIFKVTFNNK